MIRVLCVMLLLAGCHATLPDPATLDQRPNDFILAATTFTPPAPDAAIRALPRALRPARYIIEADGFLRTAVGAGSDRNTYPPPTRQLSSAQMDRVWAIIRDSGLLEPGNQYITPPQDPGPVTTPSMVLFVAYEGGRSHLLVPLDRADAESVAAESLLDELAALSWID